LTQIASHVGCSRGTVHNDLVRFLGARQYAKVLSVRKRNGANVKQVNASEVKRILDTRLSLSENGELATRLLKEVLIKAEQHGVSFLASLRAGGAIHFYLSDKRTVRMRIAVVDGDQPEHRFGLHRFRVSSGIRRYDFAIFAIDDRSAITTYVFKVSEIASVQSLALRYKWFDRESRYDFARDRWSIFKASEKN
jgi:hypothetical protein